MAGRYHWLHRKMTSEEWIQDLEQQTDEALLNCSAGLALKVSSSRFRRHYYLDYIIL